MNNIYYFGCSHSMIFGNDINKNYKFIDYHTDSVSLKGLKNVNSKTNYNNFIINNIDKLKNNIILFKIGQVDIEFGYYYKTLIKNECINIEEFTDNLIEIYEEFLNKINYSNYKIIICGISLPAYNNIKHSIGYKGSIINLKKYSDRINSIDENIDTLTKMFGTLEEQTKNSLLFNEKLKNLCQKLNLPYIDFTEEFIDNTTNILKKEYTTDSDHHYKSINDKSNMIPRLIHQNKIINLIEKIFK